MTIQEFLKDNTITDPDKIMDALCMPNSARGIFKVTPLIPIGVGVWKTDKMPPEWSNNDQFTMGTVYPIYSHEDRFVIGKDGKGKKFNVQDWKELVWF
jgi:hypothetical protein